MKTGFGGGGYWYPVNGWRLRELTKFFSTIAYNMASTAHHEERTAKMAFASVFPLYGFGLGEGWPLEAPIFKLFLMSIYNRKVSATTSFLLLARCCYAL